MGYVKLIAKDDPDGWFKPFTEVFHYDEPRRITTAEWTEWVSHGFVLCRGIRCCKFHSELHEIGEDYEDGESCLVEEFEVEFVNEASPNDTATGI